MEFHPPDVITRSASKYANAGHRRIINMSLRNNCTTDISGLRIVSNHPRVITFEVGCWTKLSKGMDLKSKKDGLVDDMCD